MSRANAIRPLSYSTKLVIELFSFENSLPAAAQIFAYFFSKESEPVLLTSIRTNHRSPNSPPSSFIASGSATYFWIARQRSRAELHIIIANAGDPVESVIADVYFDAFDA